MLVAVGSSSLSRPPCPFDPLGPSLLGTLLLSFFSPRFDLVAITGHFYRRPLLPIFIFQFCSVSESISQSHLGCSVKSTQKQLCPHLEKSSADHLRLFVFPPADLIVSEPCRSTPLRPCEDPNCAQVRKTTGLDRLGTCLSLSEYGRTSLNHVRLHFSFYLEYETQHDILLSAITLRRSPESRLPSWATARASPLTSMAKVRY